MPVDKNRSSQGSSSAQGSSPARKGPAILFVCTANIVRSPMAEGLFRARIKQERSDWQYWQIDSAGTWAINGEMAAKNARQALANRGLDIIQHRSRTVTADMLASYDLILTMEPGHKEALKIEFPFLAGRVYLLSEMEGQVFPVEDCYGSSLKAYEETAEKIDQILERGMAKIISLVKENE